MSDEAKNVAMLKQAYQRWSQSKGSDHHCWLDIAADDVCMGSLPDGALEMTFTASRNGVDEMQVYLSQLTKDWEMLSFDMDEFVAQGDRVVAIGRVAFRHRATGKIAETPKVDVWRLENGKLKEFFEYFDTAKAYAAAR